MLHIEVFEGTPAEKQAVVDWFSGNRGSFIKSGSRSVLLEVDEYHYLKIKGAGRRPEYQIQFEEKHRSGPVAFRYDYEGRRMEDVALGHDAAFEGGMTYQQASIEYKASNYLKRLKYYVVPCIGWGKVDNPGIGDPSFFAVVKWRKDLQRVGSTDPATSLDLLRTSAHAVVECHFCHHVGTYFSCAKLGKDYYLYDLHPTRLISTLTDSSISAAMTMLYNLRVQWWGLKAFCRLEEEEQRRAFADEVFRAVLPDASYDDCRNLERDVIVPMLSTDCCDGYSSSMEILRANRVSSKIYDTFHTAFG